MNRPMRLDRDTLLLRIAPAALLALAIGFAVAQLGSPLFAPVLAAGGFAGAYLFLVRLAPGTAGLAAFDPPLLVFAAADVPGNESSPGELLLEDEVHPLAPASPAPGSPAPGSNVIALFGNRPEAAQPNAVGDASEALSAALAGLRRAASKASD